MRRKETNGCSSRRKRVVVSSFSGDVEAVRETEAVVEGMGDEEEGEDRPILPYSSLFILSSTNP